MSDRKLLGQLDKSLLLVALAIAALGIYNLASAGRNMSANLYMTQAQYMVLGLILMTATASIDYRSFESLAVPFYLTIVGLLVLTMVAGRVVNGSRRWLTFGPVNFQTSDIAKIAVILVTARMFHLHRREQHGGLTLNEIFRPFNVSRPLLLVVGVLALTLAGDTVKPPSLKQKAGHHSRTVAKVRAAAIPVLVGRAVEATVQLPYGGIEPRHAELARDGDGRWLIRDLGTEAGTYVNGERVSAERVIHTGDVLRFGINPRAELTFSDTMETLQPFLPWLAVLGALWLFVALWLQFKSAAWTTRDLFAPVDVVFVPAGMILVQPDLGTALICTLVAFTIILYVGFELLSLIMLGVFSVGGCVVAWFYVLKPYQKNRVLTFLDPELDPSGAGYHQHQSVIAIGSGQLWGKGHGHGTQTQFSFLPEQQTDFIFSVWGEEHGFIGCLIVVALYGVLVLLCLRVANQAKDRFGQLVAIGVTALVFWHASINMLMVIRLAPVVGVPLPLFSYGGSFVITMFIALGIVLNVGMRRYVF